MLHMVMNILLWPVVRRLHRRLDALEARLIDVHAHVYRKENRR